jgi:hypothetical protein
MNRGRRCGKKLSRPGGVVNAPHAVSRNDHSAGRSIEQVACVPCRDSGKNFASGLRAVKFLPLTLATTCLLSLVVGCGGEAPAGPDAVREPPPLFLGPAPRPLGPALINGRVVDFDTGQRLEGAKIDAVDQSNAPLSSLTTDAAGEFRMELARAGLVRFRVSAAGYPSYDRNHFLEAGTRTLEIAMRKAPE